MKMVRLVVFFLISCQVASAQLSLGNGTNMNYLISGDFYLDYLRDDKSADLVKTNIYEGVEESPFLSENWAYARIKLSDNRVFDSVKIKLNLFEHKVHFIDNNKKERMIGIAVKELEIRDLSSPFNNTVFVSGYGKDPEVFYQVISDGKKIGYMKEMKKIIKEYKVFNAPVQKKFELQSEKLCLYSKGTLYEESKNCSSLLSAFNNDSKVMSYMSSNGLKCNKEKDLKKLVEYYNSY